MKQRTIALTCCAAWLALCACGPSHIDILGAQDTLLLGTTMTLNAVRNNETTATSDTVVTWTSSDESIATVSPFGVVSAVAIGLVVIRAEAADNESIEGDSFELEVATGISITNNLIFEVTDIEWSGKDLGSIPSGSAFAYPVGLGSGVLTFQSNGILFSTTDVFSATEILAPGVLLNSSLSITNH